MEDLSWKALMADLAAERDALAARVTELEDERYALSLAIALSFGSASQANDTHNGQRTCSPDRHSAPALVNRRLCCVV